MEPEELSLISQIDRSEVIRAGYVQQGKALQRLEVNWDSPTWTPEGDGERSVAAQIRFCREHLERGGRLIGAFDGNQLVGIGVITPEIRPGLAQLAYLHVTKTYRRGNIGNRLAAAMIPQARQSGAHRMYVSAIPSGSAVGFYLHLGFMPVEDPLPVLYALDPEDIHMMMDLWSDPGVATERPSRRMHHRRRRQTAAERNRVGDSCPSGATTRPIG